jgi:hypothetical protein
MSTIIYVSFDLQMSTEFKDAVSTALKNALDKNQLDVTEAAQTLGVSRQIMHKYLAGKALPGIDVLYRACSIWDMRIEYRDHIFGAFSLAEAAQRPEREPKKQESPALFSFQDAEDNFAVKITARSERHLVQLAVRLVR